jgi:hypothetical protein
MSPNQEKWLLRSILFVAIVGGCRLTRPDSVTDIRPIKPAWGIPATIQSTFKHLKTLELPREVDEIGWLGRSQLKCLDISDSAIRERLSGLPPTLKVLHARNLRITQLNLPKELSELDVRSSDLSTLADLPGTVHTLAVGGNPGPSRVKLPSQLSTLVVEKLGPEALAGYPGNVHDLEIVSLNASRWRVEFSQRLTTLRVESLQMEEIPNLPTSITSLVLIANPRLKIQHLPAYLVTFRTEGNGQNNIGSLLALTDLTIAGSDLPDNLPTSLTSLTFLFQGTASSLKSLAIPHLPHLRKLSIQNYQGSVTGIPVDLDELDITGTPKVSLDSLPKNLRKLAVGQRASVDLAKVPPEVRTLDISNVEKIINATSYKLPKLTELIYRGNMGNLPLLMEGLKILDVSDSANLAALPKLPSTLTELRIRNTGITSLPVRQLTRLEALDTCGADLVRIRELPSSLTALRAHAGQLDSGISFPESLKYLAIRTTRDCGADELWKRLMEYRAQEKPLSGQEICYE